MDNVKSKRHWNVLIESIFSHTYPGRMRISLGFKTGRRVQGILRLFARRRSEFRRNSTTPRPVICLTLFSASAWTVKRVVFFFNTAVLNTTDLCRQIVQSRIYSHRVRWISARIHRLDKPRRTETFRSKKLLPRDCNSLRVGRGVRRRFLLFD